ncbi:hypothetical protein [Parapedobacter koreensis]|uniref:Uncharacterized protein n=1 Tax=Parapedobacter koreensis TaxID=332977 RepID=A0A1H7UGE9_9SPHI|nr:hypothetical protein [Parapedobacter koreensis]SEL95805.1 hypothetical protein SAMN05421740_11545 [Parapedobacter koreensis]
MKKIMLSLILIGMYLSLWAQYAGTRTLTVTFPNETPNQVCYLYLPTNVNQNGVLEITITGSFDYELNTGVLKKRITFMKQTSGYFNASYEVLAAVNPLAEKWHIGDFDPENNRIPIYHLTSTGNRLSIKVDAQMLWSEGMTAFMQNLTVSNPETLNHGKSRQYKSIMQDRVGIGTLNPAERLSVNGNIRAKEVKVEMANWPDYVFKKDYALPSLDEVDKYIQSHGHLPGMPTAQEAVANGVELGEMNRKLLEKVEELTLHLIEKDKFEKQMVLKIEELGAELKALKNKTN